VLQNAAMGFEPRAFFERDNKIFVPQADQLGNIPRARFGSGDIE
jgi:hypothetical protein